MTDHVPDTWAEENAQRLAGEARTGADWLVVCQSMADHPNRDAAIGYFAASRACPGAAARVLRRRQRAGATTEGETP